MQIDFENDDIKNAPPGVNIETLGHALVSLTVVNDGPGNLFLATVSNTNSSRANTPVKPGEKFELKTITNCIKILNLAAKQGDVFVRILGFY